MEKKPHLASHKERLSTQLWRWLKTLFFLFTMLASLLLVCAPPLLIVVLDLLLPPALLSTFLRHNPTSSAATSLSDQVHNFDFRSSLFDLPLVSVARSLLILCAYVVCDGRGAYLGIAAFCSLASVGYVSVKGVAMFGVEGVRRIMVEGKDGVVVIEALFLTSVALAVAHVIVAYRTSCRERRKLLVYRIDIEAVDKRYRRYCEQMKVVVSSFEAVAGEGSAAVYSALASKTMSRHFRCLRDGIVGQIQATKKAMGEKDPVAPGSTRGETPRLKILDQCLRQQKAFQQGALESHPWRPQRGLPERSVSILRAWLFEHFLHPYPSDVDKHILARQTGLSRSQVSNWFINARVRLWKPMVEEMYLEETKEQGSHEDNSHNYSSRSGQLESDQNPNPNTSTSELHAVENKPTPADLLHESGSLSSIINPTHHHSSLRDAIPSKATEHAVRHYQQTARSTTDNFGVVDLDFASYNQCSNQSFGGGGVSLTLGLQQHSGGSMNLSFSPAAQNSLFFSGEPIEQTPSAEFSIIDGEAPTLPYRNLMGAQLLHDLAG